MAESPEAPTRRPPAGPAPGVPMGRLGPPFLAGNRVNVASLLTGLAIGAVLSAFAFVSVVPDGQPVSAGRGAVLAPGDEGFDEAFADEAGLDGEAPGDVGGTRSRRSAGGGAAGAGNGGSATGGGVDVGGGLEGGVQGPGGGPGGGGPGGGGGAATTTGVSDDRIKLGATWVDEGIAKPFLGEVRIAMDAVASRVNKQGGIHGRNLDIVYKADQWNAGKGKRFIENLIVQDQVFALAVSPSSEGLNAAANDGVFKEHGVPVVGADGLNNSQFIDLQSAQPNAWIWPVASATTTQVHVIMKDAWQRCEDDPNCDQLRPAIVFGNTYRFGVEGAFAFNGAYCRLTGGTFGQDGQCDGGQNIPGFGPKRRDCRQGSRYCGIEASEGGKQYTSEINTVNSACDAEPRCNFLLLLVEPKTAQDWMGGARPARHFTEDANTGSGPCCGMAGAQPLFTQDFARECGRQCDRMRVWTGYNPPITPYDAKPEVARYVEELERESASADRFNQFTMGGYIGMELLVEALERVGPNLTREALVQTLNSMPPLQTGLTKPGGLSWTAQERYANNAAQAFRIDHASERFDGWEHVTDYVEDPWTGQDNRLP